VMGRPPDGDARAVILDLLVYPTCIVGAADVL
jgi:hypothetical protein